MNMKIPKVVICCMTYNHEKYIKKTLEGFISQITQYRIQVIIHDDASTDRTPEIINEYVMKYPDVFIPILQKHNQYSKGVNVFKEYIKPLIDSDYIAECDGDDFWCDDSKIQKQISYLEEHKECSATVHNSELIREDGSSLYRFINSERNTKDYTTEDIIMTETGSLFQFSSIVYRSKLRIEMPEQFSIKGIGDASLAIWLSMNGCIHYFPDVMSKYRVNSAGSWTSSIRNNKSKRLSAYLNAIEGYQRMDSLTDNRYHDLFSYAENRAYAKYFFLKKDFFSLVANKGYLEAFLTLIFSRLNNKKTMFLRTQADGK